MIHSQAFCLQLPLWPWVSSDSSIPRDYIVHPGKFSSFIFFSQMGQAQLSFMRSASHLWETSPPSSSKFLEIQALCKTVFLIPLTPYKAVLPRLLPLVFPRSQSDASRLHWKILWLIIRFLTNKKLLYYLLAFNFGFFCLFVFPIFLSFYIALWATYSNLSSSLKIFLSALPILLLSYPIMFLMIILTFSFLKK